MSVNTKLLLSGLKHKLKNKKKDVRLYCGDSLHILKTLEDNSVDSIVTDPPAGISFMNKDWDKWEHFKTNIKDVFEECFRVLKPGAHGFVWAIPRTSHHTAMMLEESGFEIRDVVVHVFGSGFPKSCNISKQFDKAAKVKREDGKLVRTDPNIKNDNYNNSEGNGRVEIRESLPITDLAKKWDGWGTALKPATEHWILIKKPSIKPVYKNVEKWGTGGINIDVCRVDVIENDPNNRGNRGLGRSSGGFQQNGYVCGDVEKQIKETQRHQGRFPANLIHDGSEVVEKEFLKQGGIKTSGDLTGQVNAVNNGDGHDYGKYGERENWHKGDTGSVSRYFNNLPITEEDFVPFKYQSKASKKERNEGLDGFEKKLSKTMMRGTSGSGKKNFKGGFQDHLTQNNHPTVKSISLMEWLIKLVTPKGGVTLDPFLGSGSSGVAAIKNGFKFIGIEKEKESFKIAEARIEYAKTKSSFTNNTVRQATMEN